MMIMRGAKLKCRETGDVFTVTDIDNTQISYDGVTGIGLCDSSQVLDLFEVIFWIYLR